MRCGSCWCGRRSPRRRAILTVAPLGADGSSMAPWPRSFLPNQTSNLLSRGTWLSFLVRRIAAQCAYVHERGAFGIRLEPAAAIVRRYGGQNPPGTGARADEKVGEGGVIGVDFFRKRRRLAVRGGFSESARGRQLSLCRRTAQIGP
jgi:hypothetical protein